MYQKVGPVAYKKDLTNSLELDEYLDHPHKAYKTIHVAGTNGKGTTCHLLASILQTAGYKVGLYTSPHLKDFRERIRINGKMISKKEVVHFIQEHKIYLIDHQLSFFEMTVGMAFDAFKKHEVDIAVIETGLGGRLDSTNIITPILSIITSIDKDHQDLLGKTLAKIAMEKAGIIKQNVPILINEHRQQLRKLFKEYAFAKAAPLHFNTLPSTINPHDNNNARTLNETIARSAIQLLQKNGEYHISQQNIEEGIAEVDKNTSLQGRYQILQENPKIIADVAHNPAGIKALMRRIENEFYIDLHIVFGMVKGKSLETILPLLPKSAKYYLCEPDSPRKLEVVKLKKEFDTMGLINEVFDSPKNALKRAKQVTGENDLIVIGGSTFIVAEIL